jgi:hypothetical protein
MKSNHITSSDMIGILCNLADEKTSASVMLHLESCENCRRDYETFQKSLAPDKNAGLPGPRVKDAILSSLLEKPAVVVFNKHKLFARIAIAASLAIIVPLFVFLTYTSYFTSHIAALNLFDVSGNITINAMPVLKDTFLEGTAVVESSLESYVRLKDDKGMIVEIGPETKLTLSYDIKYNRHLFILDRGTIIIQSKHTSSYMIASNGYTIKPVGTSYFVSARDNGITVGVSDGSVSVCYDLNKSEFVLIKNSLWTSGNSGVVASFAFSNPPSFDEILYISKLSVGSNDARKDAVAQTPPPENKKESDVEDNTVKSKSSAEKSERREINQEKKDIDRERKSRTDQERGQKERRGRQ